ncbi:MAG: MBL fold metallo-hydrolase [Rubrobacteraceae bacterium]
MAKTSAPELVAPGVYRVDAVGLKNAVSVLLLENDDGWTRVDTGIASSVQRIKDALTALGSGAEDLKRILITHQHDDHVGGLKGMVEWAPNVEVGATDHEAKVISGERGFDPQSNAFLRYMSRNAKPPGMTVAKILQEGDVVSGFRLISTPGHSIGHISMLRDSDGLLFTADAFGCMPRKLRVGVQKAFCNDPAQAKQSAAKLLSEDFATAVLCHGPAIETNAKSRLSGVMARCRY